MRGEAAPKLFETWLPLYAERVLHLAKEEGKLAKIPIDDMTAGKYELFFWEMFQN